jgi:hypothetical protein
MVAKYFRQFHFARPSSALRAPSPVKREKGASIGFKKVRIPQGIDLMIVVGSQIMLGLYHNLYRRLFLLPAIPRTL